MQLRIPRSANERDVVKKEPSRFDGAAVALGHGETSVDIVTSKYSENSADKSVSRILPPPKRRQERKRLFVAMISLAG